MYIKSYCIVNSLILFCEQLEGIGRFVQSYKLKYTAIKTIALSRPSDKEAFHQTAWDASTRSTAIGLKTQMESFSFIVSLVVVKEILAYLSAITKALQGMTVN